MRICRLALITTTGVITCNYRRAPSEIDERVVWRRDAKSRRAKETTAIGRKVNVCASGTEWPRRKDHDGQNILSPLTLMTGLRSPQLRLATEQSARPTRGRPASPFVLSFLRSLSPACSVLSPVVKSVETVALVARAISGRISPPLPLASRSRGAKSRRRNGRLTRFWNCRRLPAIHIYGRRLNSVEYSHRLNSKNIVSRFHPLRVLIIAS